MSFVPAKLDFTVYQGATFRQRLVFLSGDIDSAPRNLTGYSASMPIKDKAGGVILLTASSGTGEIDLGDTAGTIDIVLTAATTSGFTWDRAEYELLLTAVSPNDTDVIAKGKLLNKKF